jgi:hypothetical protein
MKRAGFERLLIVLASVVLATAIGCSGRASAKKNTLPSATSKPTPEESFAYIADTFQRRVEGAPIGFIVSDAGGRSMMSGTNKVSHKLLRPAKEGEPYKGIITVESQSNYSLRRSKTSAGENADRDQSNKGSSDAQKSDENGVEIYDSQLVTQPGAEDQGARISSSAAEDRVAFQQDVQKRDYELVYENGRWSLKTELNKKTELSIINAFDQALKTQK